MNLATILLPRKVPKSSMRLHWFRIECRLPEDLVVWRACKCLRVQGRELLKTLYVYRCDMIPGWPTELEFDELSACNLFVGQHSS